MRTLFRCFIGSPSLQRWYGAAATVIFALGIHSIIIPSCRSLKIYGRTARGVLEIPVCDHPQEYYDAYNIFEKNRPG
jgi:hypothetical protein